MKFDEFKFTQEINEALSFMGFEQPTPVQELAIPIIQQNKDLIACAQTGTGKTAAFLLPLLDDLAKKQHAPGDIHTLVIVPTRELAIQIDQALDAFGYFLGVSTLAIYGGGKNIDWNQQKQALTKGADFIVATPGRLLSHLSLGYGKLSTVKNLVLDEADKMLDMGFFDDIISIVSHLPKKRQTLMFSATMPEKIRKLAGLILDDPESVSIAISKPAKGVLQGAYVLHDKQKVPLLVELLEGKKNYQSILVFTSSKKNTLIIARELKQKGFRSAFISSDLEQKERELVLRKFKSRDTQILVATDVLSRGIDIKDINLVINFDVPRDVEDYIHRIGRTARAETTGVALTLIGPRDQRRFQAIEKFIGEEVQKLPMPKSVGDGPAYKPGKGGGYSRKRGKPRSKTRRKR